MEYFRDQRDILSYRLLWSFSDPELVQGRNHVTSPVNITNLSFTVDKVTCGLSFCKKFPLHCVTLLPQYH